MSSQIDRFRKNPWWLKHQRPIRLAGGMSMLIAGVPMLFLPAPGAALIIAGLGLLSQDYPWAGRILGQVRHGVDEVRRKTDRFRSHRNGKKPLP